MNAFIQKEIRYYFQNPVGYITLFLFGVFVNFLSVKDLFVNGAFSLPSFFMLLPWIFLIFIPAIAMRGFAEEKRLHTMEIILSLPLSELSIVVGKFAGVLVLILIGLLLTASVPLSISLLTPLHLPEILVGYIGALLIGAMFTSISLFFSLQTKNQIVAFLMSSLAIFFLLGLSSDLLAPLLPKIVQDAMSLFGPINHFQNFAKGIVDVRSAFYFISLTSILLVLMVAQLEKRK